MPVFMTTANRFLSACLIAFFLFSSSLLNAQIVVKGTVISKETTKGLPFASIAIEESQTGTTTDIDGKFELKVADTAKIIIEYLGHQSQEVQIYQDTTLIISLDFFGEKFSERREIPREAISNPSFRLVVLFCG